MAGKFTLLAPEKIGDARVEKPRSSFNVNKVEVFEINFDDDDIADVYGVKGGRRKRQMVEEEAEEVDEEEEEEEEEDDHQAGYWSHNPNRTLK